MKKNNLVIPPPLRAIEIEVENKTDEKQTITLFHPLKAYMYIWENDKFKISNSLALPSENKINMPELNYWLLSNEINIGMIYIISNTRFSKDDAVRFDIQFQDPAGNAATNIHYARYDKHQLQVDAIESYVGFFINCESIISVDVPAKTKYKIAFYTKQKQKNPTLSAFGRFLTRLMYKKQK